jgi:hypothetical protein
MTLDCLENPDLFSQFVINPEAFIQFLKKHWDKVYTSLFVYQLRPVNPNLPCAILHIIPALHGKATAQVIEKLLQLREILTQDLQFSVGGLAFDGNSMFSSLHTEFEDNWTQHVSIENPKLTLSDCSLIIFDPLHLMKRIHHRWVSSEIAIAFRADPVKFALRTLEGWNVVSPVVFMNSHIAKMHDSLLPASSHR